jgi:hypothetical protein
VRTGRPRIYTHPAEIACMAHLYHDGASTADLAAVFNASPRTIAYTLRRAGFTLRGRGGYGRVCLGAGFAPLWATQNARHGRETGKTVECTTQRKLSP